MEYVKPVIPGHTAVVPAIAAGTEGVPGFTVTAKVLAALVPQLFVTVTLMLPF